MLVDVRTDALPVQARRLICNGSPLWREVDHPGESIIPLKTLESRYSVDAVLEPNSSNRLKFSSPIEVLHLERIQGESISIFLRQINRLESEGCSKYFAQQVRAPMRIGVAQCIGDVSCEKEGTIRLIPLMIQTS